MNVTNVYFETYLFNLKTDFIVLYVLVLLIAPFPLNIAPLDVTTSYVYSSVI